MQGRSLNTQTASHERYANRGDLHGELQTRRWAVSQVIGAFRTDVEVCKMKSLRFASTESPSDSRQAAWEALLGQRGLGRPGSGAPCSDRGT